ncbi:Uncharacterized protein PBTT_06177 [Plasmodiophora brassicae]
MAASSAFTLAVVAAQAGSDPAYNSSTTTSTAAQTTSRPLSGVRSHWTSGRARSRDQVSPAVSPSHTTINIDGHLTEYDGDGVVDLPLTTQASVNASSTQ